MFYFSHLSKWVRWLRSILHFTTNSRETFLFYFFWQRFETKKKREKKNTPFSRMGGEILKRMGTSLKKKKTKTKTKYRKLTKKKPLSPRFFSPLNHCTVAGNMGEGSGGFGAPALWSAFCDCKGLGEDLHVELGSYGGVVVAGLLVDHTLGPVGVGGEGGTPATVAEEIHLEQDVHCKDTTCTHRDHRICCNLLLARPVVGQSLNRCLHLINRVRSVPPQHHPRLKRSCLSIREIPKRAFTANLNIASSINDDSVHNAGHREREGRKGEGCARRTDGTFDEGKTVGRAGGGKVELLSLSENCMVGAGDLPVDLASACPYGVAT